MFKVASALQKNIQIEEITRINKDKEKRKPKK